MERDQHRGRVTKTKEEDADRSDGRRWNWEASESRPPCLDPPCRQEEGATLRLEMHPEHHLQVQENSLCHCLVTKSCPALCNPMEYSLPASSVGGISQARVQRIFPTQGSNLSLLHWQMNSLSLNHAKSPQENLISHKNEQ